MLGDLRLDAGNRLRGVRFLLSCRRDRLHRGLEVGLAVSETLDVEAQARERLRDTLEILRARARGRAGEAADLLRGRSQGIARAPLAQHLEGPE